MRLGPPRAAQSGWLTPARMRRARGRGVRRGGRARARISSRVGGWPIAAVGAARDRGGARLHRRAAARSAITGSATSVVFVFFGIVAVCGTYFVQARRRAVLVALAASLPVGALATRDPRRQQPARLDTDRARRQAHAGGALRAARGARSSTRRCSPSRTPSRSRWCSAVGARRRRSRRSSRCRGPC